jgi:hypothetical protein
MLLNMLDPAFAIETWNQSLPPDGRGEPRLSALSVLDAVNGPRWSVQYLPQMSSFDRHGPSIELLVAQCFPNGELEGALAKARRQEQRLGDSNRGWADWIAARPGDGLLLYPFPLDPRIRRLPEALSGEGAWQVFGAHRGLVPDGFGTPESCSVEVLRYVPGKRCQLRYTFIRRGRVWQLLGKMFREGRGERLFEDMQTVAARFECDTPVELTTPRPLAYLPEWNMVVQSHFPGKTLYELMQQGLAGDSHIAGAARSIAHLHSGRFTLKAQYLVADELALLCGSVAQLHDACLADARFDSLLEKTQELPKDGLSETLVPVHRDFYDKQLLVHEGTIALIDLDTLALGHAEIDVANFLAHLLLRRLQGVPGRSQVRGWGQLFLEEYRRSSGLSIDPGITRFFMAAAFLRLACKYRLKQNRTDLAQRLLGLAESILEIPPQRDLMEHVL